MRAIVLGDQVDPDSFNATLYRDGAGLAPAELAEVVRPSEPARLVVVDRLHPTLRGLARDGDPLGIGQIPFFEFYTCAPWLGDTGVGPAMAPKGRDEWPFFARRLEVQRVSVHRTSVSLPGPLTPERRGVFPAYRGNGDPAVSSRRVCEPRELWQFGASCPCRS